VAPADRPKPSRNGRPGAGGAAFSLIELLVVIAIIALLATIGLPALRGLGKSNRLNAASRQMVDDLALARLRAINSRTTVYVVFAPTNIVDRLLGETNNLAQRQLTNLLTAPYTTYALLTKRTVGDQPGREFPQYVTDWRRLPDGIVIPAYKFMANPTNAFHPPQGSTDRFEVYEYAAGFDYLDNVEARGGLPFPIAGSYDRTAPYLRLPVLGFDSMGRLLSGEDEIIPLAEGSIFFKPDRNGRLSVPDLEIKPPKNWTNNFIRVNWLTGRAVLERRAL
jgi:prepilin-type N-terminal cleavage/methylation domain-containing protein